MKKYICNVCGYIYDPAAGDPDSGVAPGERVVTAGVYRLQEGEKVEIIK